MHFQTVGFGEALQSGQAQLPFSARFDGLIVLVGHAGFLGCGFLAEPVQLAKFLQAKQQAGECVGGFQVRHLGNFPLTQTPLYR